MTNQEQLDLVHDIQDLAIKNQHKLHIFVNWSAHVNLFEVRILPIATDYSADSPKYEVLFSEMVYLDFKDSVQKLHHIKKQIKNLLKEIQK